MSSARVTAEAAEIIERILEAMPSADTASAREREAYLRGVVAGWKASSSTGKKA